MLTWILIWGISSIIAKKWQPRPVLTQNQKDRRTPYSPKPIVKMVTKLFHPYPVVLCNTSCGGLVHTNVTLLKGKTPIWGQKPERRLSPLLFCITTGDLLPFDSLADTKCQPFLNCAKERTPRPNIIVWVVIFRCQLVMDISHGKNKSPLYSPQACPGIPGLLQMLTLRSIPGGNKKQTILQSTSWPCTDPR